ncbi:MAG TPA: asparagine synthase (glutamine-hydrolyzing) [Alphaproteobacteria bacterium]|nr:asparagine synthase (glutamine-hydrolyzing) [Alphaproteobacteria bacterium]
MCGLAALFAYGAAAAPASPAELRAIRDRMKKRGPDGAGEWFSADGRVALGHRRLSIIDLRSIADQPMAHDANPERGDRLRIVFNGEIYNYRELRAELVQQGRVFRTESDTEVILQLYDRDGADCVKLLRGMFAFALWDEARQGLLLARDPLGIKPLYVADDGRTLRVASQVKALLAGQQIDTRADPAGHCGFFLWGNIPDPYTLYRGIRALPAGTTQWIDREGARQPFAYWNLVDTLSISSEPRASQDELREALIDSLRHHFVADVPVGVFLSAGLDSTTIAALASEDGADNLRTLTLGFREYAGQENDETRLAELVAEQRHTRHTTRWVAASEFAAERASLMDAMDQPSIDGTNTYFVAKAAHEAGLKVALSGLGGDEIFAGYPSFRQVPQLVRLLGPFAGLAGFGRAVRRATAPWLKNHVPPKYPGLLEYGTSFAGAYMLRRALFMPWELEALLPREMVDTGLAELDTLNRLDRDIARLDNPRLKVTALEIAWYMRHQLLRDSDWAGMAHSLEIRVPLVDAVLLARLAPLLASARPPSKGDMADACRTPLPAQVRNRAKTGFVVPVREWVQGETSGAPAAAARGFRGWARLVYAQQAKAA